MREDEEKVESEPSGSSELCEGTTVVGSVGGLRGTEKSVQLPVETAAAQSEQSNRPELYQISQVATPSNSSNAIRLDPSRLRPRDP